MDLERPQSSPPAKKTSKKTDGSVLESQLQTFKKNEPLMEKAVLRRIQSSPPGKELDRIRLQRVHSGPEYQKIKTELDELKELFSGTTGQNRLKTKVLRITQKISSGNELKLVTNLGTSYHAEKTPEELMKDNYNSIIQIIRKKWINLYPNNPWVSIFEGTKNASPKSPRGKRIIKYFCVDPIETSKICADLLYQKQPGVFY